MASFTSTSLMSDKQDWLGIKVDFCRSFSKNLKFAYQRKCYILRVSQWVFFPKILFFIYFENSKVPTKMWKEKNTNQMIQSYLFGMVISVTFWIWFFCCHFSCCFLVPTLSHSHGLDFLSSSGKRLFVQGAAEFSNVTCFVLDSEGILFGPCLKAVSPLWIMKVQNGFPS